MTPGAFQLCLDVLLPFFLGETVQVIIHDDPLAQRLMDSQPKGIVQLRQPGQEDYRTVTGIHLKVKKDFQVIEDGAGNIVGLVNDDDRGDPFFQDKTV